MPLGEVLPIFREEIIAQELYNNNVLKIREIPHKNMLLEGYKWGTAWSRNERINNLGKALVGLNNLEAEDGPANPHDENDLWPKIISRPRTLADSPVVDYSDPAVLKQEASYIPHGWNLKRLGKIVKERLGRNIDPSIESATAWLAIFEVPDQIDGAPTSDHEAELELMTAAVFGRERRLLPRKKKTIGELFSSETAAEVYQWLVDQVDSGLDVAVVADNPTLRLIDGLSDKLRSLALAGGTVEAKTQTEAIAKLRAAGKLRIGHARDAQNWLRDHSSTPRHLLIDAWMNRREALKHGVEDSPSNIVRWANGVKLRSALDEMIRSDTAPDDFTPEDIDTLWPYANELLRYADRYKIPQIIDALAEHKRDFNPDSFIPGRKIELSNGWTAEILEKDDPRGYTIGADTGCCMQIAGESCKARECIFAGYSDPRYGFFALYDEEGKLAAQSLLYVNPDEAPSTVVIDNIEINSGRRRDSVLSSYREFFSEYIGSTGDKFDTVNLGVHQVESYKTLMEKAQKINTPIPNLYWDASFGQFILCQKSKPSVKPMTFMPLSREDIHQIQKLESIVYEDFIDEPTIDYGELDTVRNPDVYSYLLKEADTGAAMGYVLAHVDVKDVGFNMEEALYISDFALLPEYRGGNYAYRAFKLMLGIAESRNVPILFHAKDDSSWSIIDGHRRVLSRLGYKMTVINHDQDYYMPGQGAHLVKLEKTS